LVSEEIQRVIGELKFNDDGLIPAIAQAADDGAVLMLAWMSAASIEKTLQEGRVVYWSRSRREFWRKGDTSGHIQELVSMRYDCDQDCLLLLVKQTGPACHTGKRSCFFNEILLKGVSKKGVSHT
jgi:phosphoribosyl-AMP cyclohydrolase